MKTIKTFSRSRFSVGILAMLISVSALPTVIAGPHDMHRECQSAHIPRFPGASPMSYQQCMMNMQSMMGIGQMGQGFGGRMPQGIGGLGGGQLVHRQGVPFGGPQLGASPLGQVPPMGPNHPAYSPMAPQGLPPAQVYNQPRGFQGHAGMGQPMMPMNVPGFSARAL